MTATKTVAASLIVLGALVASPVQAERIGNRSWRWTSWNVRTGSQSPVGNRSPLPVVPVAAPAPAPAPAPPTPAPAPAPVPTNVLSNGGDDWMTSPRFAVPNPNPSSIPVTPPPAQSTPVMPTFEAASASSAPVQTAATYDALINLSGNGNYPDAASLVLGTPQPWYNSPVVARLYGRTPDGQQQAAFAQEVLQDVRNVFERSGLHNIDFTADPNADASHTLSVVSGVSYDKNPNVIGITNVGQSGLTFIDKFTAAESVDQLATIVANNVSHELMHAFGVCEHFDKTGKHLDAADATWESLTDPNATLSPEAVEAILARQPWNGLNAFLSETGAMQVAHATLNPTPVPEPSTVLLWTGAALVGAAIRRIRSRARA
jgi:hypothetical protein